MTCKRNLPVERLFIRSRNACAVIIQLCLPDDRAEKRLRMRAVDSFWRISFSSPEAAIHLASAMDRDLWPTQRSNTCACLSHARAILARVGMGYTISIETSERQNGGRFKVAYYSFPRLFFAESSTHARARYRHNARKIHASIKGETQQKQ